MRRLLALTAGLVAAWWFVGRPWTLRWGSTPDERVRPMPGDDLVLDPDYETTKAVTVHAPPEAIWPWLVQIGRGRGGLYSIDWLDRLFGILDAPSATEILPQYQHLEVGDVIPIGGTAGWPVRHVEENRCLALGNVEPNGMRWSWTFALYPQPDGSTRLISRNQVSIPSVWARVPMLAAVDPPAFIMTVAMLLGLRKRAEAATGVDTLGPLVSVSPRSCNM